ncbi:MAG: hypothetical protein M3R50_12670, partial [Bacteroidota bacterium]|nr:hypothetical protein [Bacteroidota bacterium]
LGLIDIPVEKSDEELETALAQYLDQLIINDFNKLVAILYRIDVSQEKAVKGLSENLQKETAGQTLAKLIIKRQKEKLRFRRLNDNENFQNFE